jgi:phosphomannomutase/phosphoglucomutase
MNLRSFREYDIRGVAERDLDDATVRAIGEAFAAKVAAATPAPAAPVIAVGRDPRVHSPRLFAALTDGIRVHADVLDIGVGPTPLLYFAAQHLAPRGVTGAVMITGSHNPPEDNGFKLLIGTETLHGAAIAALRDAVVMGLGNPPGDPRHGQRSVDCAPAYLERVQASLRLGARRCKVVVDAGNGAGGPLAVALYKRLGFDVVPLYCDMDGRFPNHHPDPTIPENVADLIARVKSERAELGIALDGDADRIGAVDGTGRILWGDQLMILLGKAVLREIPEARFVGEVKCSQAMYDQLTAAGGRPEMWKVGHSLIKARMKEVGAQLAGEMSGHLFFAHRWLGFDDAIYAGARLLELLSSGAQTLASYADELPVMINTPELRVDCPDERKFAVVAEVKARLGRDPAVRGVVDVDGVRAKFDGGWGLVRASNTQAALVVRCEADTEARLAEVRAAIEGHIAAARDAVG